MRPRPTRCNREVPGLPRLDVQRSTRVCMPRHPLSAPLSPRTRIAVAVRTMQQSRRPSFAPTRPPCPVSPHNTPLASPRSVLTRSQSVPSATRRQLHTRVPVRTVRTRPGRAIRTGGRRLHVPAVVDACGSARQKRRTRATVSAGGGGTCVFSVRSIRGGTHLMHSRFNSAVEAEVAAQRSVRYVSVSHPASQKLT